MKIRQYCFKIEALISTHDSTFYTQMCVNVSGAWDLFIGCVISLSVNCRASKFMKWPNIVFCFLSNNTPMLIYHHWPSFIVDNMQMAVGRGATRADLSHWSILTISHRSTGYRYTSVVTYWIPEWSTSCRRHVQTHFVEGKSWKFWYTYHLGRGMMASWCTRVAGRPPGFWYVTVTTFTNMV